MNITEEIRNLIHSDEFKKLLKINDNQITLSFEDLLLINREVADYMITHPLDGVEKLEEGINSGLIIKGRVRFTDISRYCNISIREMRAKHYGVMSSVDGVIKQAGEVISKIYNREMECPNCGSIININQDDEEREPSRCTCGYKGPFKVLREYFVDLQTIVLEESPDNLEIIKQPKRLHVVLEDGLVDPKLERRTLPGSRVLAIGVLKDIPIYKNGKKTNRREKALMANNIIPLNEDFDDVKITPEEEEKIKELSKQQGLMNKFVDSFSSSILGNEHIKRAIILQLLGGSRRKKSDGQFSRDNIHILLIGNRSTGKSVLLKNASEILPKSGHAVGKGISGVGLTAAVVKDEITGQYMLESGLIPMANGSMVAIDEIDKVKPEDRDFLHECMEQGSISINKAQVSHKLNARTSILAAANPRNSEFNYTEDIAHQINMPLTLISRFDCIFIMKDEVKDVRDNLIADKILNEHTDNFETSELNKDMIKKYILYARKFTPILNKEAIEHIKEFYTSLRREGKKRDKNIIQIATRQLEGIIRLTEASAKLRLSDEANKQDAEMAIEVMKSWLKDVGYDSEAGVFDVNSIMEPPKGKKAKFEYIMSIFRRSKKDKMSYKEIEMNLEEALFKKEELWEILKSMKLHGLFFEPTRGIFQTI